ncbi:MULTISPECIES: hypothetical protein [unclassified Pseudomonas]|uniref:hypothetical protein n=1 Tax=unclassified Pseudomonas TaxID=196821 RepID=UPI002097910D|nr:MULTISPECIES: hypothetical protein [unclassified Pseudomonas]MCO7503173.1 hypothetical protein [Pseudomonas sp. VE 267-6A]MCO7532451.1 hypothetical protein [Pseudomonas sp. 2]
MEVLDRPIKRIGFTILLLGLALSVVGAFQIASDSYRASVFFERWVGTIFFERYAYKNYPATKFGFWIFLIGILFSFLYDRVIGKFFDWIANGGKKNKIIAAEKNHAELYFKDAKSVLEYSCKYMDTSLNEGEFTPCIVVATSSSRTAGTFAVIDIPSDQGIRRGVAAFSTQDTPSDVVGKLCAAMIGPMIDETGSPGLLLFAELEPTWQNGSWKVKRHF